MRDTANRMNMQGTTQLWKTADIRANKEGQRHKVYWPTGEQYQGEWRGNKKHGKGTMVYKNGDKYEGDWEDDLRSGLGIYYSYVNGLYRIRYQGEWRMDRPHGRGTLYTDKGEPYEGSFQDGLRHGQGRQVYGGRPLDGWGGDVYEGDWFEDKRSGRGTLTLGNGDVYEGSWQADLKHGEGTYYYMAKNKRYDGIWSEGTAKCGTYSEIQQSLPGDPGMLPVLELARPRAVIDDARATIIKTHMATTQE